MAEDKNNIKDDVPEEGAEENLNSTMMAIDVNSLDLKGVDTKTEIKIEVPSDDEIIQEQLAQKKSSVVRFFSRIFKKDAEKIPLAPPRTSPSLQSYINVWLCDPVSSVASQIYFYLLRFIIIVSSIYIHYIIISQILSLLEKDHPASLFLIVTMALELIFVLLTLFFKRSPGWLITLPLSLFGLIVAYFALFLHTANPLLFTIKDLSISEFLNTFYLITLIYVFIISVFEVGRRIFSRILFGILSLLCLLPMAINYFQGINLELSFFGQGFLANIPFFYAQPTYLSFHLIIPVLLIVFLFVSFLPDSSSRRHVQRGFVRSLTFLLLVILIAGFALMQKNRVFHVLNLVIPQRLDVGSVQMESLDHAIKVETVNFDENAGKDKLDRYKFSLTKGKKSKEFLLQVVDKYDFPIRNLSKRDLIITNDGVKVKKYKMVEDPSVNLKRGNYVIQLDLKTKEPLISWDKKKIQYTSQNQIELKLSDLSKVKRLLVKHEEKVLLDLTNPKKEKISLPLNYFGEGNYKLDISLYDRMNKEIFSDDFSIKVKAQADFGLLSPVEGDVVQKQLRVLLLPKALSLSSVESATFSINNKAVPVSKEDLFFNSIDISDWPDGTLTLKVSLKLKNNELSKSVVFKKQSNIPELVITEPSMGSFSTKETKVSFQLKNAQQHKIAGVKIFVNGDPFNDFVVENNSLSLPMSRWFQSEMYVTVQAALDNGTKLSDWVQINKGLSLLELVFDKKSLSFLNYKNTVVVLDGSISHLDNWQGSEKWRVLRKIVSDPDVDSRIESLKPTYLLFGAQKPHYYNDCDDFEWLIKKGKYNATLLNRKMSQYNPNGVSAIVNTLKEAYRNKPDKVYLFADNRDSCTTSFSKIKKIISKSKKTQVIVFAMGEITASSKKWLTKLAESTQGKFYQPDNFEELKQNWLSEMVLSYEIYQKGKLVSKESLGEKKFYLPPGEYTLKIPYATKLKDLHFSLENSSKTSLLISGKGKNLEVKETKSRL